MRKLLIAVAVLVAIPAVFYVAMRILWETSGEVAAVRTFDAAGEAHDTHLWIVDVGGHAYLRTGNANAKWLARMREHPAIEVTRHGVTASVVAMPIDDAELRAEVNAAVAEKYGFAEALLRKLMLDPNATTPIRVDPTGQ